MNPTIKVGNVQIYQDGNLIQWTAGLSVDADGAPNAYAPKGSGLPALDDLICAGKPGKWWGIATDNGKKDGNPIIQGPTDPFPGYYVSTTALGDRNYKESNPLHWVDATQIPYVSVPPEITKLGVHMGDVAYVEYNGKGVAVVVADVGPEGEIGEGSMALADLLGINSDPKHGGVSSGVKVSVWKYSKKGWPRPQADIDQQVQALLKPPSP